MSSIKELQEEIIDEFSMFEDWMGKYEHLIEYGKSLSLLDDKFKTEEYEVRGCQAKVWLHTQITEGKLIFEADSDAIITKGIIGLLVYVLSNHDVDEILETELYFINEIGLREHLSPTRSNGLVSMIKQMKIYALGYKAKA
ncbi:MAG: SufE family protein [Flavobacteriales bacterium]|nr:SufE family protein [Flavobacteriales bacterium]